MLEPLPEIVTFVKLEHSENAKSPTLVMLPRAFTLVSLALPEKVLPAMLLTLLGMVTLTRLAQA